MVDVAMDIKGILACPICGGIIGTCKCLMYDILKKYVSLVAEKQIEIEQAHGQISLLKTQLEGVMKIKQLQELSDKQDREYKGGLYPDHWREARREAQRQRIEREYQKQVEADLKYYKKDKWGMNSNGRFY
jgi:hypothetical protein